MLYPTKTPVLISNVLASVFLAHPFPFPKDSNSVCQQFQEHPSEEEGKACLECVLTPEGVTLKGMKNGWVIERSPEYTRRQEGKRAELTISCSWAEWLGRLHSDHRVNETVTLRSSRAGPVQLWEVSEDDSSKEEEEKYLIFTLFFSVKLSSGAVLLCWNT